MSPDPEPEQGISDGTSDVALRRYDVISKLLVSESSLYWTRAQTFTVANAGLIGFVFSKLPTAGPLKCITWISLWELLAGCVGGILLCFLWFSMLTAGNQSHDRCWCALEELEKNAFPANVEIVRKKFPHPRKTRIVARNTAVLFVVLWSLTLLFVITAMALKAHGKEFP